MKLAEIAALVPPLAPALPKASLAARLGVAFQAPLEHEVLFEHGALGRPAVTSSEDLARVLAVPRRPVPSKEWLAQCVEEMTALLRRDNPACLCAELNPSAVRDGRSPCIERLLPIQAWYLWEARERRKPNALQRGGVIGFIGVGHGKTGIDILLPMVLEGCKTAILLIPPALRKQFSSDYILWSQHFNVPNLAGGPGPFYPDRPVLEVLPYSQLSRPENTAYLRARKPDTVIGDEAHALKNPKASGTSRFLNFIADQPDCEVWIYLHGGSFAGRGMPDFWHLLAATLGESSPAPLDFQRVKEWGGAIDPVPEGRAHLRAPMGALRKLCNPGEDARVGFGRRLVETSGVISTTEASVAARLVIGQRVPPSVPAEVREAIHHVKEESERPDGETLMDILEIMTCCRQIACGFFYYWRFPHIFDAAGNEVHDDAGRARIVEAWRAARKAWFRELRDKLERRTEGMDSEALVRNAAIRHHEGYKGPLPTWAAEMWPAWAAIKDQVEPVPATTWISDYLVRDAAEWGRQNVGIIWCLHGSFARAMAKETGFPRYGSDVGKVENLNPTRDMIARRDAKIRRGEEWHDRPSDWIEVEDGSRTIIASIKAHGTGKKLQAWHRCLVANLPADGEAWEQMLGRLHRQGQTKESVFVEVYQHTPEMVDALSKARGFARYKQPVERSSQRLLYADWQFDPP